LDRKHCVATEESPAWSGVIGIGAAVLGIFLPVAEFRL
jgi:hypothetical protein